jgi:threonylcarbamoyladenosine tRNA methylthiotransferase MtaB
MMRFAIATLGCKVNQYDSALIEARLRRLGLERCDVREEADVYIVNTCAVTDRADAESLRLARRARRRNPAARVIMTGCLAQASSGLLAKSEAVDAVVGLGRPGDLERAVLGEARERVVVSNLRKEKAAIELGAVMLEGHTRAFLKVQEGCDQFCSFCIIPFSRGRSRSVEPRRIIEALDGLHEQGVKEVVLTGVHLGGYGKDLDPPITLEVLLEMIAERVVIPRLRLSSLDPEELSDRIIEIVASDPKFCPHFHLPLQSGEDTILTRMRRRYLTADFRKRVERLVWAMPEVAIGTDLIAGFPGERATDFESYFKFVEALPLAYFHVFPYSVREGTTAAKLDDRVEAAEIRWRAAAQRELGGRKARAFAARFVGSKLQVLVEEVSPDGWARGHSRNYLRVLTQAGPHMTNQEVEVSIESISFEGAELVGQVTGLGSLGRDGTDAAQSA